jgi:hypothetical protein
MRARGASWGPVCNDAGTSRAAATNPTQEATAVATREEIADILAGFALFSDLQTPQLLGVAGTFEEVFFPLGERVLR